MDLHRGSACSNDPVVQRDPVLGRPVVRSPVWPYLFSSNSAPADDTVRNSELQRINY